MLQLATQSAEVALHNNTESKIWVYLARSCTKEAKVIADCRVTCLALSYAFQRRSNPDPTLDSSYIKYTTDDDLLSK